jgi:hypothetical protein
VSLGVPVDLDEILPASKQKKLVRPSIHIPGERSPRPSADSRNGALGRVKKENASSTSVDSSASKPGKRKGPPPPPQLDISSTTMLCSTTDAALGNFTDAELQAHVKRLEELSERANEVFAYWQKRMESALGDKDAVSTHWVPKTVGRTLTASLHLVRAGYRELGRARQEAEVKRCCRIFSLRHLGAKTAAQTPRGRCQLSPTRAEQAGRAEQACAQEVDEADPGSRAWVGRT